MMVIISSSINQVVESSMDNGASTLEIPNPLPPWVITLPATNIDPWGAHATLRGTLLSKGLESTCDVWFVWDTRFHLSSAFYAHSTPHSTIRRAGTDFFYTITGLKRGVTYHFRAVANNGYFTDQGVDLWFTPGLPYVETLYVTNLTFCSADLNGYLHDDGGTECEVWFIYDTVPYNASHSYRFSTDHLTTRAGRFSINIGDLEPNATYYFKAVASNDVGTVHGFEREFTTKTHREENNPPHTPDKPDGPIWGRPGKLYTYSTSTIDPDRDRIRYYFNWGDGTGNWSNWIKSGTKVEITHSWENSGMYSVKVKAQDEYQMESNWSESLIVTIEDNPPNITVEKPLKGLYLLDRKVLPLPFTFVIGKITIEVNVTDRESGVRNVEFYIDDELKFNDTEEPYEWLWDEKLFFRHKIEIVAYDRAGNKASTEIKVWKLL